MICCDCPERPAEISRSVRDGAVTLQHRGPPYPPLREKKLQAQGLSDGGRGGANWELYCVQSTWIVDKKATYQARLPAPLLYRADASASESWSGRVDIGGADRWLSVSYPEIATRRLSGWSDLSGDVTRRGPIAGFRAWHGIRQLGARGQMGVEVV